MQIITPEHIKVKLMKTKQQRMKLKQPKVKDQRKKLPLKEQQ